MPHISRSPYRQQRFRAKSRHRVAADHDCSLDAVHPEVAERLRGRARSTEMPECHNQLTWLAERRQMMAQAPVP